MKGLEEFLSKELDNQFNYTKLKEDFNNKEGKERLIKWLKSHNARFKNGTLVNWEGTLLSDDEFFLSKRYRARF